MSLNHTSSFTYLFLFWPHEVLSFGDHSWANTLVSILDRFSFDGTHYSSHVSFQLVGQLRQPSLPSLSSCPARSKMTVLFHLSSITSYPHSTLPPTFLVSSHLIPCQVCFHLSPYPTPENVSRCQIKWGGRAQRLVVYTETQPPDSETGQCSCAQSFNMLQL